MTDAYRAGLPVVGQVFGRLTVLADCGTQGRRGSVRRLLCRCVCGAERIVRSCNLQSGNTKSCGCLSVDRGRERRTHGLTKTSAYWRWRAMIQRCVNPRSTSYPTYGGRGIRVCSRWLRFESFYSDMGAPPAGKTLDRIDPNSDYSPENCRWETPSRQARNFRRTPRLTYQGRTMPLIDWAEEIGINFRTLHTRIKRQGWSVEDALSRPVGPNAGRRAE